MRTLSPFAPRLLALPLFGLAAAALTIAAPAAANGSVETSAKRTCVVKPNHIPAGKAPVRPPVVHCEGDVKPVALAKKKPVVHPGPRHAIIAGAVH